MAAQDPRIGRVSTAPDGLSDEAAERRMRAISRRSFFTGALGMAGAFAGWRFLISQQPDAGIPWPFRRAHEINEGFSRAYFRRDRRAPEFAVAQRREPRVNGDLGMGDDFDPEKWRLKVVGLEDNAAEGDAPAGAGRARFFTLDDIRALPRVQIVTELKCIEGWSVIVHWAGARLADFLKEYPPAATSAGDAPGYVGLETPDGGYYVGMDMDSALHPQTLLCYEMNGAPLTLEHGAPLRLVAPTKYGIKHIKRIGLMRFADSRPKDYWAEQGYDWYSGH